VPTGKVKWFDAEKGFGFLSQEDGPDVYVRADALPEGVTTVKAGTRVEFGVAQGRRGDQALQVRILDKPTSVQRNQSHANGHRWVVSLDEPWTSQTVLNEFRIWDVWGSYMAGAGGCEFFQTGDATFDDFRTKEAFYTTVARARQFIEANVPFATMDPADTLATGASAYVLAKTGQSYLVYLPAGGVVSLNLTAATGTYDVRWFDPRNGGALLTGSVSTVSGGANRSLGNPPNSGSSDWAVLVKLSGTGGGTMPAAPTGLIVH